MEITLFIIDVVLFVYIIKTGTKIKDAIPNEVRKKYFSEKYSSIDLLKGLKINKIFSYINYVAESNDIPRSYKIQFVGTVVLIIVSGFVTSGII